MRVVYFELKTQFFCVFVTPACQDSNITVCLSLCVLGAIKCCYTVEKKECKHHSLIHKQM